MTTPLLRVVKIKEEILVTVCDKKLLGKTFRRGGMKLEVKKEFYDGIEADMDECIRAVRKATVANLVGSVVKHALKAGIICEEGVFYFQGVPHAQLVRMEI